MLEGEIGGAEPLAVSRKQGPKQHGQECCQAFPGWWLCLGCRWCTRGAASGAKGRARSRYRASGGVVITVRGVAGWGAGRLDIRKVEAFLWGP